MNGGIAAALHNWIPYKLISQEAGYACRWLYLGDTPFTEPFFDQTISSCRVLPQNSAMRHSVSTADILPAWAGQVAAVKPAAFIFHISRCGSTLVSQLLALQQQNIVLSEVPFFDELLRSSRKDPQLDADTLLPAAIALYGARRKPESRQSFIKTDSWHVLFYSQLRALYPDVPFVLLYRHPAEVLRSQQRSRGMQAVPGLLEPELFGFSREAIVQLSLDAYMAKVLECYLQAFQHILKTDKLAMAVNYNEGALTIVKKTAAFTGTAISGDEIAAMQERAGYHAKYPGQVFAEQVLAEAPPAFLEKALSLYAEVEALRLAAE